MQSLRREGMRMESWSINDLRWISTFSLLILLGGQDIMIRKVDAGLLLPAGIISATANAAAGKTIFQIGEACIPGIFLAVLGKIAGGIGLGDIWLTFVLGQIIGGNNCMAIILYSALLCLPVMLVRKQKVLPFVPFMLGGCYIQWLLSVLGVN